MCTYICMRSCTARVASSSGVAPRPPLSAARGSASASCGGKPAAPPAVWRGEEAASTLRARLQAVSEAAEGELAELRSEIRRGRREDKAQRKALAAKAQHEGQREVYLATEGVTEEMTSAMRHRDAQHSAEVKQLRGELSDAHRQLRDLEAALRAQGSQLLELSDWEGGGA